VIRLFPQEPVKLPAGTSKTARRNQQPGRKNQLPAKDCGVSSPTCQRCQIFYSGHVQGVGFRYTTRQIAGNYAVTGFVRNLPDGRVELVAEGTEAELTAFLTAVDERLGSHIRSTAVERRDATGEFTTFQITH
jgi:acylphosphatase